MTDPTPTAQAAAHHPSHAPDAASSHDMAKHHRVIWILVILAAILAIWFLVRALSKPKGDARRWPARSGGYRAGQSRKYRRVSRRARHRHAGIHGDRREPGGRGNHGNPFQGRADRQEQ